MQLSDLFFWTDCRNRVGFKNIGGDELAALINASGGGPSAQVGKGAVVQRAPTETIPDGFPGLAVIWTGFPNPVYDDLGFFDSGDPTKLTIPDVTPAIERVTLTATMVWSSDATSDKQGEIKKNGVTVTESGIASMTASADLPVVTQYLNITGGPFSVVAGDFFTLQAIQFSSPSATKTLARAVMSITVVK